MFVHYTFSSVWVAQRPPFGKELPIRLVVCSHCILSVILVISHFGFESGVLVLIVPVSVSKIKYYCGGGQNSPSASEVVPNIY